MAVCDTCCRRRRSCNRISPMRGINGKSVRLDARLLADRGADLDAHHRGGHGRAAGIMGRAARSDCTCNHGRATGIERRIAGRRRSPVPNALGDFCSRTNLIASSAHDDVSVPEIAKNLDEVPVELPTPDIHAFRDTIPHPHDKLALRRADDG